MSKKANPTWQAIKHYKKASDVLVQTYEIATNVGDNDCDAQIALEEIRMLIDKWTKEIL